MKISACLKQGVVSALLLASCTNTPEAKADQLVSQNKPNVQQFAQLMIQPDELPNFYFETTKINSFQNCSMSLSRRALLSSSNTTVVYSVVFCNTDQASQELFLDATKKEQWHKNWVDVSDVIQTSKAHAKQGICYESTFRLVAPGGPTPTENPLKFCGILARYGPLFTQIWVSSDSGSPLTPSLSQMWEIMSKREEKLVGLNSR